MRKLSSELATPVSETGSTCLARPENVPLSALEVQRWEAAEMWPDRSDGNSETRRERREDRLTVTPSDGN